MALRIRRNKVTAPPACPLLACMQLLRGAWAPNVIWYLSAEPRRFGELRIDMPKISARVLSARLRELQNRGVVARRVIASSPPSVEYELTELGHELVPAIHAIVDVGHKLRARTGGHEPSVEDPPAPGARSGARAASRAKPRPLRQLA
jgi:DNA-binding HxlR family transcriptional regulator